MQRKAGKDGLRPAARGVMGGGTTTSGRVGLKTREKQARERSSAARRGAQAFGPTIAAVPSVYAGAPSDSGLHAAVPPTHNAPRLRAHASLKVVIAREESKRKMAAAAEFPSEFLSLEADFVDSKMAINNSINTILRGEGRPCRQRSSKTLEDSHRLVTETEEVGISVLDSLAQQRESLLGAHEKVRETGAMTTEARRILQRMTRRIITNTIVLYTVIFVLIVAICYVIYADFIKVSSVNPFAHVFE
ncbi:hypothetical protein BBJ28_00002122 [Nothophytophthora sp. Chile5]|nr:hypothetical protein BBJ28_00002122 [Nothophytophthora sp. Chile5]